MATLLNDNPKEVILLGDSDSDSGQPPKTKEENQKLSEIVATTPSQQLPAPSQISALLGSPSAVLPTAASVSIPITQQLHDPSPTKNSTPDILPAGISSATSAPRPMEVQQDALLTDSSALTSVQQHGETSKQSASALPTDSSPSTSITSQDMYLKAIREMYPLTNIDRLRRNMAFSEDWRLTRTFAGFRAFTTVKSMIDDKKLEYDDRASLSDDDDSESSVASYMQKKTKKTNMDDEDKKFFTCLATCYALFFAFDSKDAVESYCPFASHNKCWQKENSLESILEGYDCKNRSFKADELRQHVSQNHSKSWCGMGLQLFLHDLYPSPITANKEFIAKHGDKGSKRKKSTHPQTSIPYHLLWSEQYRQSRRNPGPLGVASSGGIPSRVNELTSDTVSQSTSRNELNSTKDTPLATPHQDEAVHGEKGKKRKYSAHLQTSDNDNKRNVDDSIYPTADYLSEKIHAPSGIRSVQGDEVHPAKRDHRGERDKGDDSDHNNRECNRMDESIKGEKGDDEQKELMGEKGDGTEREKGGSDRGDEPFPEKKTTDKGAEKGDGEETNKEEKGDGTESDKGESDEEDGTGLTKEDSDKEDEIESQVPKYKVGTFVMKEVDSISCTGVIHNCSFDKTSFIYFVHFNELDLEETINEADIEKLVFTSDDWIVMKDLDVFVRVGTTNHPAKIDSMVRLSEELVDTKSLRVRWIVNNKKEVVELSSVVPMYSSEGNNKKRIPTKPPKPTSIIPLKTHKSRDGLPEKSNYPRKLLVGLSYKCKHYIKCNSLPAKQKTAKMVEKRNRMPNGIVTFRDNYRLYQRGRSNESSLSCDVTMTTGMELFKEENVIPQS